jgi:hypothetical protein
MNPLVRTICGSLQTHRVSDSQAPSSGRSRPSSAEPRRWTPALARGHQLGRQNIYAKQVLSEVARPPNGCNSCTHTRAVPACRSSRLGTPGRPAGRARAQSSRSDALTQLQRAVGMSARGLLQRSANWGDLSPVTRRWPTVLLRPGHLFGLGAAEASSLCEALLLALASTTRARLPAREG